MSSDSPYFSLPLPYGHNVEQVRPVSPHEHSRQRPSQPLRRSSPVFFRDFFDAMSDTATRRHATLPRPVPSHQDPLHNVNRALENANRALQDAQQAFHQARRLRSESAARRLGTDSEPPNQLVDLARTNSPPTEIDHLNSAESHYISHTTHPHDSSNHRSRRFHSLDQPVYGHPQDPILPIPRTSVNVRFWPHMPRPSSTRLPPIRRPGLLHELPAALEEEAISRQRENHSNWQRTQARNRERQRHQGKNEIHQDQSSQSSHTTMSPPSSSQSRPANQSTRRRPPSPAVESDEDDPSIDEVDLTAVHDPKSLSAALAKQREDAIYAQNPGSEAGRTPLTAYKCPVCMETPIDATSTACGHVFCHRCIIDTLNWSSRQRQESTQGHRPQKGVCPVCRKPLDLKDTPPGTGRGLIPLELKFMAKKRKRGEEPSADKGKGKENSVRATKRERQSTEDELWDTFIDAHEA